MRKISQQILKLLLIAPFLLTSTYSTELQENIKQWIDKLHQGANEGQPSFQCCLGDFYLKGKNVEQDSVKAFNYYQMAADQGNALAQYELAELFFNGNGCGKNLAKAIHYYRLAAEHENSKAQQALGTRYYLGEGVEKDTTEALKWHRLAAKQRAKLFEKERFSDVYVRVAFGGSVDPIDQYELAEKYYKGNGVEKNYEEAVKYYRLAADHGHGWAQYSLANCCYNGNGIEKNYVEAIKYCRLAADQGNPSAQNFLGNCYYSGIGVKKNVIEAVKCYRLAADQGDNWGQYYLANCYYSGEGVKKNYEEAVKYYRLAADQGHSDAQYALGNCYYSGRGVEKNDVEAVKYYRLAADQGHSTGQNRVAFLYFKGFGVKKNYAEAAKYYRLSANQGHKDSACQLNQDSFLAFYDNMRTSKPGYLKKAYFDKVLRNFAMDQVKFEVKEKELKAILEIIEQMDCSYGFLSTITQGEEHQFFQEDLQDDNLETNYPKSTYSKFNFVKNMVLHKMTDEISKEMDIYRNFMDDIVNKPGTLLLLHQNKVFNLSEYFLSLKGSVNGEYFSLDADYRKIIEDIIKKSLSKKLRCLRQFYIECIAILNDLSTRKSHDIPCFKLQIETISSFLKNATTLLNVENDRLTVLGDFLDSYRDGFPNDNLPEEQIVYFNNLLGFFKMKEEEATTDICQIEEIEKSIVSFIEDSSFYRNHLFLKSIDIYQ